MYLLTPIQTRRNQESFRRIFDQIRAQISQKSALKPHIPQKVSHEIVKVFSSLEFPTTEGEKVSPEWERLVKLYFEMLSTERKTKD